MSVASTVPPPPMLSCPWPLACAVLSSTSAASTMSVCTVSTTLTSPHLPSMPLASSPPLPTPLSSASPSRSPPRVVSPCTPASLSCVPVVLLLGQRCAPLCARSPCPRDAHRQPLGHVCPICALPCAVVLTRRWLACEPLPCRSLCLLAAVPTL